MKKWKLRRELRRTRKQLKRANDDLFVLRVLYDNLKKKYEPPDWEPLLSDDIDNISNVPIDIMKSWREGREITAWKRDDDK